MLLVKTKIGPSKIAGIGLFADEPIPKGTVIWKFEPGFDIELNPEDLNKLSEPAKKQLLNYMYLDKENGKYILCSDDARFFNHSESPNCDDIASDDGYGITLASKDIAEGEELLYNYHIFDKESGKKLVAA